MRAFLFCVCLLPLSLAAALSCSQEPAAPQGVVLRLSYEGPPVRVVEVAFCIEAALFSPEGGALEARVLWGSTAPAVASVDASGCVMPRSLGRAVIWAAVEGSGVSDTVALAVVAPVRLTIETDWPAQVVGRPRPFRATIEDGAGRAIEGLEIVWSSSDVGIAQVGRNGVVRAVAPGDVMVAAREPQSGLRDSLAFHSAAPGEAKWRWALPEGEFSTFGGPALAPDGRLYVITRWAVLHALESRGTHRWSVSVPGVEGNHATVAPDGRTIYAVGTDATFAVSGAGEILWAVQSLDESAGIFNAAAVSADGTAVYAADGAQLRALVATTGQILWESPVDLLNGYLVPPTISPDGSRVFARLLSAFDLRAFDAATGAVLWSVPDPSTGVDNAVFNNGAVWADGRLFHPLAFSLVELNPETGEILWQTDEGGRGWSEPAVGPDGTLYLGARGEACARRPGESTWVWRNPGVHPAPAWAAGPALAADGTVYFVSGHAFWALEAATGDILWRYPPDTTQEIWFYGAPLIGPDGTVYSYSQDTLFAFWEDAPPEPDSPWPMWRHDARRSGQAQR